VCFEPFGQIPGSADERPGYRSPMALTSGPADDFLPEQDGGFSERPPAEVVADHAMGLELQLVEVVEQVKRAAVQERWDDLRVLRAEEASLEAELASTAEAAGRLAG